MAKKIVAGTVDRVEGDVIVVVAKDPDSGENREIYVKKKQLKKIELKEGDEVTVEMSQMVAESKKDTVTVSFMGLNAEKMAKNFFSYLIDGGLEDQVIQALSGKGVTLAIEDYCKKRLAVLFECMKENPVKTAKAAKKPAKKTVKKVPVKRKKKPEREI
jgi:translation initiation factor IF-1